jgi:hypothetical protein
MVAGIIKFVEPPLVILHFREYAATAYSGGRVSNLTAFITLQVEPD